MIRFVAAWLCLVAIILSGISCQQAPPLYQNSQLMMGTVVEVISSDKQAADIAFREIKRIEGLLSLYINDSEISQLNKKGRLKASPETIYVIKKAGEFWQATQGTFDITIAPLMELWGFYDKNYRVPEDSEIEQRLGLIGFDKLKIDDNIIEFKAKGMKIDLGAIAKGFAIDCAVKKLQLAGIKSALLNAGGDIFCLGDKQGIPWRVAVRSGEQIDYDGYLELKDMAVATSGNYEQYFFVNDTRYCHILNPKTGRPAESGIASITVIANDCLSADALATSIFVLGEEDGKELAEKFNAEVRIYTDVKGSLIKCSK
jgi:thiamine biosynthesis lipoprotein